MALKTLGTAAQTTLSAIKFNPDYNALTDSDLAALNALIKPTVDANGQAQGLLNNYISRAGQLWIPNRGWLYVSPNDYIAVDTVTGWPILLSAPAAASASFVHT